MKAKSYTEVVDNIIHRSFNPNPLDFAVILEPSIYYGFIKEMEEELNLSFGVRVDTTKKLYYKGYLIIKATKNE